VTEGDPLHAAKALREGQRFAVDRDATVRIAGHRLGPAEDAERERLLRNSRCSARRDHRIPRQRPRADGITGDEPEPGRLTEGPSSRRGRR
jgi:hypothetical protein